MANRVFSVLFLFAFICLSCQSVFSQSNEEQRMGWSTDFKQDSRSLPSIEVKLSPPENPQPQVSAEIKLLENARLKLEESLMEKLEDEFNKSLSSSKIRIQETVTKSMSVFDNPNMLRSIISHVAQPLRSKNLRNKENTHVESEKVMESVLDESSGPLPPPEVRSQVSFIEQGYLNKKVPSVVISMTDIKEPHVSIKDKIEEMEQYRTDEEVMMFENAISEMNSLREITVLELEKQIQLQLNPFLVNKTIVHRTLENELKELQKRDESEKKVEQMHNQSSFIEKEAETEAPEGNIINVKISQTSSNYPTVDELVMQMHRRRDITERLERQKILDLEMKLLKAQSEMIKDALHVSISKILAQYSPIVEAMKLETLKML